MNPNTKYWTTQLSKLQGGTIQKAIYSKPSADDFYDEEFFGIEVKMPDGARKLVWILADEEGNGPGAVDITD
jgi:hypothetical protein